MEPDRLAIAAQFFAKNGFAVEVFADPEQVREAFRRRLATVRSVGFGGSATLRELGLDAVARESPAQFIDHWAAAGDKPRDWEARLDQGRAELFVTSANAATIGGQLLLTDGAGNRLAASVFGPRQVLFVLGENKIMDGLDAAWLRIKRIAAPQRARQLQMKTPCAEDGCCHDCQSPQRICRATVIIERPSFGLTAGVWLVRGGWGL
ncbi:MAG: LUD domain-containing protein [Myxococcales bacterium]|nr:LUD domain-containing protein [Myxococcales bacterium]